MRELIIRAAAEADTGGLAMLRRLWCEEQAGAAIDDPDFETRMADWMSVETSRRVIVVAERDAQLVGMMNLTVFERMPRPGQSSSRWCYLANAFVVSQYRDLGIGSQLVSWTVDYARGIDAARIVLSPGERSVQFYRRAGFGEASMLMVKALD